MELGWSDQDLPLFNRHYLSLSMISSVMQISHFPQNRNQVKASSGCMDQTGDKFRKSQVHPRGHRIYIYPKSTLTHRTPPVSPSSMINPSPVFVSIASAAGYCVPRWTDERMPATTLLHVLSGPAGLMLICAGRAVGFKTSKSSSPTMTSLNSFRRMSKGSL